LIGILVSLSFYFSYLDMNIRDNVARWILNLIPKDCKSPPRSASTLATISGEKAGVGVNVTVGVALAVGIAVGVKVTVTSASRVTVTCGVADPQAVSINKSGMIKMVRMGFLCYR
jgi:hypothetical protein